MKTTGNPEKFSSKLEAWFYSKQPKTIQNLGEAFAEKSFAAVVLLLMFVPALPLPTGGITHIFEIISMLLALEHIAGLDKIWLPNRLKNVRLSPAVGNKVVPLILERLRWFEKRSSPRLKYLFHAAIATKIIWAMVFIFSLTAFLAPPFSGLDTLPAFGVVLICFSIVLEDSLVLLVGLLTGLLGTVIVIGLGALVVDFLRRLF